MKKLIAALIVGSLAALTVVGCGPSPTSEATPAGAGAAKTATGKLDKDGTKDSVTVDGKDYKVTADTTVTVDGKADKAENLKKGQEATVTYKDTTATKIDAKKAP
jgi:hypothetical protein